MLEVIPDQYVRRPTRELVLHWVKANHVAAQLGPLAARIQQWGKAAQDK